MTHRHAHKLIWWKQFLQLGSLFPSVSSWQLKVTMAGLKWIPLMKPCCLSRLTTQGGISTSLIRGEYSGSSFKSFGMSVKNPSEQSCAVFMKLSTQGTHLLIFFHSKITLLNRRTQIWLSCHDLNGLHLISVTSVYLIKSNQNSI